MTLFNQGISTHSSVTPFQVYIKMYTGNLRGKVNLTEQFRMEFGYRDARDQIFLFLYSS